MEWIITAEPIMEWIITADHISKECGDKSRVGHARLSHETIDALPARGAPDRPEKKQEYAKTLPFEFRLFDDDGNLYYEGKCGDLNDADESSAFAPLDWAMNDAGCTTMKYRKVGHAIWETL